MKLLSVYLNVCDHNVVNVPMLQTQTDGDGQTFSQQQAYGATQVGLRASRGKECISTA